MTIERFSSRRTHLRSFLTERLCGATSYDRIAGYFSSSIVEVAGEALESMAPGAVVRVICNSELNPLDVATARAAKQAMFREWCAALPEDVSPALKGRLQRLHDFLVTGRLQVRVLPDSCFGLIHGKAGHITGADGRRLAFIGSANESKSAWSLNYEIVWTDDSPEGAAWVVEEFEALWSSPFAVDLAEAVIQDVVRIVRRTVIPTVAEWRASYDAGPAGPVVELPVYRREAGLWAHQKYFVKRAFEEHVRAGARFLLADQVGLGKTVQLALAAKLMALWGGGPVLVAVPRPLLFQWQDELRDLLDLPSAVWDGRWIDEQGVVYPERGIEDILRCPRRVGIVSTGLIVQSPEVAGLLGGLRYECVILDEAHRARRRNLGPRHRNEKPDPNHLLRFLQTIAPRTRSLLLATATPVQIDPIEAWDLLEALSRGNDRVLGSDFGRWRRHPREALDLVLGHAPAPSDLTDAWEWIRDPLPPAAEDRQFGVIRRSLTLPDTSTWADSAALDRLGPAERGRLRGLARSFFQEHNPFIRHIVRRTRDYLETTLNPETHEPFLKPVSVHLFGERPDQSVTLPPFLQDAYAAAESFCEVLGKRPGLSSGFLKTILLRRTGSTITAGLRTAQQMLRPEPGERQDEDDEGIEERRGRSALYPLTDDERRALERFIALLEGCHEDDPKALEVERILLHGADGTGPWIEQGCIIFSQYYDSVIWLAARLSRRLPDESIAVYAGASRSGIMRGGEFTRLGRDTIKAGVQRGELRLLLGTDAASEGLNLQRLGSLINLDLPWNPTRLEQRKGRIQRIGQVRDEVLIYNMRYRGSVEDRVHQLLSERLQAIRDLFGQLPDTLEDVWVHVALRQEEQARHIIDEVPAAHPFEVKYHRDVEPVDWESCANVLDTESQRAALITGW